MAPAGSEEALRAAIKAGADSVYFGIDKLNMRARAAKPFHLENLERIADICKQNEVPSYLALNTLIYDEDIGQTHAICEAAKKANISTVIVTDPAAIQIAKSHGLTLHMSTQANITNIESVKFYAQFADVMVLARELTIDQIETIVQQIDAQDIRGPSGERVRIELFIHGALCVGVAGKCGMSLALSNHSANRGDCLQICRRKFKVTDAETGEELVIDNQYVMSPKDICTIGFVDKLMASGASIFKIEGRGRSAEYVYHTTKAYREAIDSVLDRTYGQAKIGRWMEDLSRVFNRGFWQGGYYLGHPLGEWTASYGSRATEKKFYVGKVINYFTQSMIAEIAIEDQAIQSGDRIGIIGPTTGFVEMILDEMRADEAPVRSTERGQHVTVKVPEKVRRHDKVYVYHPRKGSQ